MLYNVIQKYYNVLVKYKWVLNGGYKKWNHKKKLEKRQQEYKDKMFNKFSNEFTRKIILQKQNQMLREEIERLKANQ